jgi:hypothetical protein
MDLFRRRTAKANEFARSIKGQPMLNRMVKLTAVTLLSAAGVLAQTPPRVQTFPLQDASGLSAPGVKAEAAEYLGRKCVRITVEGGDRSGMVLLPGTDFQDGVIEADLALRSKMPAGAPFPGFFGISFRSRPDGSKYESIYLRPGNSDAPDQAKRNHSVQYVSEPEFGWYRLRREWPSVYESNAGLAMETWIKVRIEVAGRVAKLFLDGSAKPILVIDGMKGEDLHGAVGLWAYTNEEAYFSNLRITPAPPQNVKNGSDVAGSWELRYASDAGPMDGVLELHRDGNKVTGKWSGAMGEGREVSGTWRNGYVELSFVGEWPKDAPNGAPGPVNAFLSGWIVGDSGKGRMRVDGRADGTWVAKRK